MKEIPARTLDTMAARKLHSGGGGVGEVARGAILHAGSGVGNPRSGSCAAGKHASPRAEDSQTSTCGSERGSLKVKLLHASAGAADSGTGI